jgi:hypothetical protein
MSIHAILAQLNATYGKPDAQTTEANEAKFCMLIQLNQTPESVFLCLEECQEVAILADNPYTDKQLISQAVMILRKSNIFPIKDFDKWEPKMNKTWALMKTYYLLPSGVHEAPQCNQPKQYCGATGVYVYQP